MFNSLKGISESITNFFTKISNWFTDLINYLKKGFWVKLKEFLIGLVVPEDDYFTNEFTEIKNLIEEKTHTDLDFINSLNLESQSLEPITYEYNGQTHTFTTFSFVTENITYIRNAISFVLWFFLALYNYRQLLYLIRGSSPIRSGRGGD